MNKRYQFNSSGINLVLGFEIDDDDNLYNLAQGKIAGKPALDGGIKLLKYWLTDGSLKEIYLFYSQIVDPENSFLNDIVIDRKKNGLYIR